MDKVIVILGPTSSGKTKLAVALAKKFNGEIISADSRQVYKGMDIGTGKDLKEYGSVPYHLIDIVSPKKRFTLAEYQTLAYKAIDDILKRKKLPIICGGTGLYISAVVDGYRLSTATPNERLRKRLSKMSISQLLSELKKVDPKTHKIIDAHNRRRIERALEIYYQTGRPKSQQLKKQAPAYDFLLLGLTFPKTVLDQRIAKRLKTRLEKEGMIDEVERLHKNGTGWERIDEFGLEYRYVGRYLRKEISYAQLVEQLQKAICNFAKRQMTWFKRDQRIVWITAPEGRNRVNDFLGR